MKGLKVSIFIRIRQDGKQKYCNSVWISKKELNQSWAFVAPGRPEHRPEGSYALRYMFDGKQRWEGFGQDALAALKARENREWQINNLETLPDMLKPEQVKNPKPQKPTLAQQRDSFLEFKRTTRSGGMRTYNPPCPAPVSSLWPDVQRNRRSIG